MLAALPSPSLLTESNESNKSLATIKILKDKLLELDSLLFNREKLVKELREMISKVSIR
jgi:hypothetical protein